MADLMPVFWAPSRALDAVKDVIYAIRATVPSRMLHLSQAAPHPAQVIQIGSYRKCLFIIGEEYKDDCSRSVGCG